METLAAISLAGNIIQFVDFGTKVTAKALEYRQSLTGRLKDHLDLESTLDDLNKLLYKLEHDAEIRAASSPSDQTAALLRQLKICSDIGSEIRVLLDQLKVNGSGFFKSYRKAFRAIWSQSALESLQKRLSDVRQQIQLHLSFEQRDQLRAICKSQSDIVASLDHVGQCILKNILEGRDALLVEQGVLAQQMAKSHQEAMSEIASGFDRIEKLMQSLTANVSIAHTVANHDGNSTGASHQAFLDTLRFRTIEDRYDDIEDAYLDTLKWVLSESFDVDYVKEGAERVLEEITVQLDLVDAEREKWKSSFRNDLREAKTHASENLSQWLRAGQGVYWIWGKPGCGKSTLMKFLLSQDEYSKLLGEWAHPYPLTIASFFIWKGGSTMQKSLIGLLQSLLLQILEQRPELVSTLFRPTYLSSTVTRGSHRTNDDQVLWSFDELIRAFKNIKLRQELRICLHIDGLDEYDGNPRDLLDLISNFVGSDGIKVLCAGRWKRVYEKAFSTSPHLAMHHLTWSDLVQYTTGLLLADQDMRRVMSNDPTGTKELILETVNKAEGVFLWVKIVVQSLINGCENLETTRELLQRLRELPGDVLKLYDSILDDLEPRYRSDISFWLLVLLHWDDFETYPMFIQQMLSACHYDTRNERFFVDLCNKDRKQIEYESQQLGNQIQIRCPNFLSLVKNPSHSVQIGVIHRTVLDFLGQPETTDKLISTLEDQPHPFIAVVAACMGDAIQRCGKQPFFLSSYLASYRRILRAEESSKINVDPLRDQLWCYLVWLHQKQAGPKSDNEYCIIPSRDGWLVSTLSDFHKQSGPLEPLLPFLLAHDTNYVLKRIGSLRRLLEENEIFWILCSSIQPPSSYVSFHRLYGTQYGNSVQHHFNAVVQRFTSDYPLLKYDVLWSIFVDQLQRIQMHLSRRMPDDLMFTHFQFDLVSRKESLNMQRAMTSVKVIASLIQPGIDLDLMRSSTSDDCDRTERSPSSLLKLIAIKLRYLGNVTSTTQDLLKRTIDVLSSRGAKEITRRPRRWSLPLPEQFKAFQGISHAQAHDNSPFQTRTGPVASQHERGFLAPRERRRPLIRIRQGEILHRTSSCSRLKKSNTLETQYICHSEFRSWADMQHVLVEQGHIDGNGLPVEHHKGFSDFFRGAGSCGLSHEEYHSARYGRSALILPIGIVHVRIVTLMHVCDLIIEKLTLFNPLVHLVDERDPQESFSSTLIVEAGRSVQERLKYLHSLMGGVYCKSTEDVGRIAATINTRLDGLLVYKPKKGYSYTGPSLRDVLHSRDVVEQLIQETQQLCHDTESSQS